MKFFRVAVLPLAFLVLVAFSGANGQPPAKTVEQPGQKPQPVDFTPRAIQARTSTIDELVTKLEALKKQKTEIEKLEKQVTEELMARYKTLQDRLSKLGVLPAPLPIVEPPLLTNPGSAPRKAPK